METLSTLSLGILQGSTEFLPISSSGHLVLAQAILQIQSPGVLVEVVLHLGTLLSVVLYFRRDLWRLVWDFFRSGVDGSSSRREVGYLLVATLPAVAVALTLNDVVERAFEDARFTGWMLMVTTVVLLSTRWVHPKEGDRLTWYSAFIIGVAQAVAILPGISRSGITIAAGLWLGLKGAEAARFAFLMSIPAILGAGLFKVPDLLAEPSYSVPGLLWGFLAAALVGYLVIAWLMGILRRGRLYFFAGYTFLIALMVIFWL